MEEIKWEGRIKWGEKDVIKKNRIRTIDNSVFCWVDGNLLHSGLFSEMTSDGFKLYGFYCLAGDSIYGLSCYPMRKIRKILRTSYRKIITARDKLVEKDLIAYENKTFANSKGLKYTRTTVQVLSLPIDKIVITRRKKTQKDLTPLELGLRRHSLTKGYGKFPSDPEQDRLIVKIMRDLDLSPEVQETIKTGLRKGKIRVKEDLK